MTHKLTVLLMLAVAGRTAFAQGPDFDGWRLMAVRSQGEHDRGELGGRAEQYMQGAARCRADPDVVYLSHDCSQTWRSLDGGATWEKPLNIGLVLSSGQSIEVDPVDCDRVLVVVDNVWDYWHPSFPGIYLSEDGGDHWERVQAGPALNSRRYEHDLAWAPSSVTDTGARRWYAALYNEAGEEGHADSALYVSDDYGRTWTRGASLADSGAVYEVQVSPGDAQVVYVASSGGLLRSADGGVTLAPVAGAPAGEALAVAFDPGDASTLLAALSDGLYRSATGGESFTRVTADAASQPVLDDARHVFVHPTDGDVFYVVPGESGDAIRTDDGGATFRATSFDLPDDVRAWRWGVTLRGGFSFVLMSATDGADVIAQSSGAAMYRTTDGLVFVNGSTLFEGANCGTNNFNIAFDETDPNRFAVGNQDIGMYYTDNGADWFSARSVPWEWVSSGTVAWGNQSSLAFRPGSSSEVVSSVGDMFDKRIAYSSDNGQTWALVETTSNALWRIVYDLDDPGVVYAGDMRSLDGGQSFARFPFPAALDADDLQVMDLCRAQPDTVYVASRGSGSILRSDDRGDTWALYATAPGSIAPFDPIPTFAVDPALCDVVYTLDADGDVARFDGAAWESLGALAHASPPDGYDTFVRAIMVDPIHPEIIYASFFGSGFPTMIVRSVDDGATWEDISYNLFRGGVSGFNISPVTGEVMVGGCSGTWVLPPPYEAAEGIYGRLVPRPSCHDGLQNGDETGVDSGGRCGGGSPDGDADADSDGDADGDTDGDGDSDGDVDADADADGGVPGGGDDGCGCRASPRRAGGWSIALALLGAFSLRRRGLRTR